MPEVLTETNSTEALSGRELDEAIAERLMEFSWRLFPNGRSLVPHKTAPPAKAEDPIHPNSGSQVPRYSELISYAMEVVEKLRGAGVWTQIQTFTHTTQVRVEMGVPSSECQEWGATMAEAICKCALKAEAKFQAMANKSALIDFESSQRQRTGIDETQTK